MNNDKVVKIDLADIRIGERLRVKAAIDGQRSFTRPTWPSGLRLWRKRLDGLLGRFDVLTG